ncbi:MAG: lytic transglycosylase domain-containing protein [Proteobacteria bacterium]|nr:lytic transglycosylase domain-containing protein [Pseudomonadota bacterium]
MRRMARPRIAAIAVRLLPLAMLWAASAASAQVYMGTASNGTVVLSNHGGVDAPLLLLAAEEEPKPAAGPADADRPAQPPLPLSGEIRAAAQRHALPESLLAAVIAVESGFNPKAVSPKGAKGLMQLMPETARRFGVKDVFAVQENLNGGAAYLRWLLTQFDNDLQLALAAYNAGEGAVARAGRRIPAYAETQDYVAKVLARMAMR